MQLQMNEGSKTVFQKRTFNRKKIITERDKKIIGFLCSMKFASSSDLFDRFFRVLSDGSESSNIRWCNERLSFLEKEELIKRVQNFEEQQSFFIATQKGFELVKKDVLDVELPKPPNAIDVRFFNHDWLVLRIRNILEKVGQAKDWKSDQLLKKNPILLTGLHPEYFPDGLYTNYQGQLYAFELELSQKSRKLYTEKIQKYVNFIRSQKDNPDALKKVHFVASKATVFQWIKEDTKLYPDLFVVEDLTKFQPHLERKAAGKEATEKEKLDA